MYTCLCLCLIPSDFLILFKSEKNLCKMIANIFMCLNVSENDGREIQFIVDNLFESPYLVLQG